MSDSMEDSSRDSDEKYVPMMTGGVGVEGGRVVVKQEEEMYLLPAGGVEAAPLDAPAPPPPPPPPPLDVKVRVSPERQYCSSTTAPPPARLAEDEPPRRLCLVCGDVASGFHYGVASCEACKAFFKRTIQGNIEYTCPGSNECEINKRRRKACQACRFRKCLRTGMLREGVRLDRVRGGRQKYRRAADGAHLPAGAAPPAPHGAHSPPAQPYSPYALSPKHLDDIKILEALRAYEPDPLEVGAASALSGDRLVASLAELYDRELVSVIGWAKQIPGFTELQLNDQMRLLQATWAEVLCLTLAYRSLGHTLPPRLRFAHDLNVDEAACREIGAGEVWTTVWGVAGRLSRVGANQTSGGGGGALREECYLLKAVALANSEARLEEHHALRKFRDATLSALNDAVQILRPGCAGAAAQQLLLVLPALRSAEHALRRFWLAVHRDTRTTMNKLFVEMLESSPR